MMIPYEEILSEQAFFTGFDDTYIQLIAECASQASFEPGDFIFHQGEQADRFYIILEGEVALEVFTPQQGVLSIQTISEGEVLGASWLFPPYRWHFEAQALKPIKAIAFDAECLRSTCEYNHGLGFELLKRFGILMMQRLEKTRAKLLDAYAHPVPDM